MGFVVQFFSLLPTLALFFFLPLPANIFNLPWRFWWPLLIIWLILYPIQTYFLYRGLREGELTKTTPLRALLPVFNIFSSYLIIRELPTAMGLTGIVLITLGTYILLQKTGDQSGNKYDKSVLYTIAATICVAIGSTLDKVSIGASTPVFYSFMNTLGASIVFLILMHVYGERVQLRRIKTMIFPLSLLGIVQAISYTSSMLAFSYGPTAYVLAVRSSSFLMAATIGVIFLREKLNRNKVVTLILFIAGIILITVK